MAPLNHGAEHRSMAHLKPLLMWSRVSLTPGPTVTGNAPLGCAFMTRVSFP